MSTAPLFGNRAEAGEAVARLLEQYRGRPDLLVLGMARGGVSVARVVAQALEAPLDVMVARKLGVPGLEEVAMGAVAEGWSRIAIDPVRGFIGVPRSVLARVAVRERIEVARRIARYRGGRRLAEVRGRTVIVVDDGLATGSTLRAAGLALRARRPARLVAAVPVGALGAVEDLRRVFDEVVAVATPDPFQTVSAWYQAFDPVSDAEVTALLGPDWGGNPSTGTDPLQSDEEEHAVRVPAEPGDSSALLAGDLGIPRGRSPRGLVILAHGGGSSRKSYRNRYLAGRLRTAGWATLRLDLLRDLERQADAEQGRVRFDIELITRRLGAATAWADAERLPGSDRIVLFGASTGAAAALGVAAAMPKVVAGVIARAGRVDLAAPGRFPPTLLVVGGSDTDTVHRNRAFVRGTAGPVEMRVVPGAGHTFEESGALGTVGELAVGWLTRLAWRSGLLRWFRRTDALP